MELHLHQAIDVRLFYTQKLLAFDGVPGGDPTWRPPPIGEDTYNPRGTCFSLPGPCGVLRYFPGFRGQEEGLRRQIGRQNG